MNKIKEEYFFELNRDLFKQVTIKRDDANVHIRSVQYDGFGIIRATESFSLPAGDIVEVNERRFCLEITKTNGEKLFL